MSEITRKNLFEQVKDLVNKKTSPGIGTPIGGFDPKTVRFAEDIAKDQVQIPPDIIWSLRYFLNQVSDSNFYINSGDFDIHANDIFYTQIQTTNGNLLYNVGLNGFSGHFVVEVNTSIDQVIKFSMTFGSSYKLILNDSIISSNNGGGISRGSFPLLKDGPYDGYNRLEIYFYGHTTSSYFKFESDLNSFVASWRHPTLRTLETPTNFTVKVDSNLVSINDTNVNILDWDAVDADNLAGYYIERAGPYNSYLQQPSGVIVSGVPGVGTFQSNENQVYAVSSTNDNGETLPVWFNVVVPKISMPSISGVYAINTSGGNLNGSGVYIYGLSAIDTGGGETQAYIFAGDVGSSSIANAIKIVWENDTDINGYLSSYKLYRGDSNNIFATNSLLATIPVTSGLYIDRGDILPIAGSPLTVDTETANKNWGLRIDWEAPPSSTSINIYRGNIVSGFSQNSLVISGVLTSPYTDPSGILFIGAPVQFNYLTTVDRNTETYRDVGTKFNRQYDYRLASVNTANFRSDFTDTAGVIAGITDDMILSIPSGIYAEGGDRKNYLTWYTPGEIYYRTTRVYESTISSGLFSLIGNSGGGSFIRMGLQPDITRFYKLAHMDVAGREGPESEAVSATTWSAGGSSIDLSVTADNPSGIYSSIPADYPIGLGGFKVEATFSQPITPYVDHNFINKIAGNVIGNRHKAYELGLPALPLSDQPNLVSYSGVGAEALQADYNILANPTPSIVGSKPYPDYELWDSSFPSSGVSSQMFIFNTQNENVGDFEVTLSIQANPNSQSIVVGAAVNALLADSIESRELRYPNKYAQSFNVIRPTDVDYAANVQLRLDKEGSPTDYQFELRSDNGGIPSNEIIARAEVRSANIYNDKLTQLTFSPHILRSNTKYWLHTIPPSGVGNKNIVKWKRSKDKYTNGEAWDSIDGIDLDGKDFMFVVNAFGGTGAWIYNNSLSRWDDFPELSVFGVAGYNVATRTHTIPVSGVSKYIAANNTFNILVANEGAVSSNYVNVRNKGQYNIDIQAYDYSSNAISLSAPVRITTLPNTFVASGIITTAYAEGVGTARASGVCIDGSTVFGQTSFLIDNQGPACTVSINGGDPTTISNSVRLTLSADDPFTGVDKFQLSDDGVNWTSMMPYVTYYPYVLPTGDGDKTVYARFSDKVGNLSSICSDIINLSYTSGVDTGLFIRADSTRNWTNSNQLTRRFRPETNNLYDLGSSALAYRVGFFTDLDTTTINGLAGASDVDVNVNLRSEVNKTYDLGNTDKAWGTLYVTNVSGVDTGTNTQGYLNFQGTNIKNTTDILPLKSGIADIGSDALKYRTGYFDDLYVSGIRHRKNISSKVKFSNLVVETDPSSPDTKVKLSADDIMLSDNQGDFHLAQNMNSTIDVTTNGLNGLDIGSVVASGWYYIWAISDGYQSAGLLSTSKTNPQIPNHYNYKGLVGGTRTNNANTNLKPFHQVNYFWQPENWGNILTSGIGGSDWTDIDVTEMCPISNSEISIMSDAYYGGENGILYFRHNAGTDSTGIFANAVSSGVMGLISDMRRSINTISIPVDSSGIIEYKWVNNYSY